MNMLRKVKKICKYLTTKLHIIISPPPDSSVKSFKIYRIIPVLILIIIVGTIGILGFLYKSYEEEYLIASKKLAELEDIKSENQRLKNELYTLTQDTKDLKESLQKLEKYNEKIRGMINADGEDDNGDKVDENTFEFQLTTLFSYNEYMLSQKVPLGGGNFHLYYQEPQELIKKMKNNLNVIKEELPDQKNNLNNLEDSVRNYNDEKAATPSIWPVADKGDAYVSSNFGWRIDPVSRKQEYHEGLDIGVWYNTPVMATADGKVTSVGWSGGYGRVIKIAHGFGYTTCYAHLNKYKVKKGQRVKRGEVIALTGNSGKSTGPHLHYEVRLNNIPQNPQKYIGG